MYNVKDSEETPGSRENLYALKAVRILTVGAASINLCGIVVASTDAVIYPHVY